jgi:hypothetical protein
MPQKTRPGTFMGLSVALLIGKAFSTSNIVEMLIRLIREEKSVNHHQDLSIS